MYLSETDVYKRFFNAVKERLNKNPEGIEYEADVYTLVAELKGMVDMIETLLEEEAK